MGTSASALRSRTRRREQQNNSQLASGNQAANGRLPYVPPSYHASAGEAAPTGTASAYPTGGRPAVPPHQQQSHPKASSATHEATTVRNLVNLKKHTLKLTPRPNAPNVLDISFMLDAVSACRVSIFLIAKEVSSTGEVCAKKVVCSGAECPVGMNINFPFEGMSPEQSSIDTSPYSADEINAADIGSWQYPLIIRLETLADKQTDGQQSLADRLPGAAPVPWVQSQTTYIVLGETIPDAEDDTKVVRQRIYVQGQFYLLQEIYGITEANNANLSNDDDVSAHCVVCLTNRKNTTVLPCRHFCMCDDCAKLLLKRTRTCPMCRLPISSVLNIQIKNNDAVAPPPAPAEPAPAAATAPATTVQA